jgi:hypothetical protein
MSARSGPTTLGRVNVVPLARLARERHLEPAAAVPVMRAVLEREGLLVEDGVDGATLPKVRQFLDQALALTCGQPPCDAIAPRLCGGAVVHVGAHRCCVCGGSANERARARIHAACIASGARRILVVGGSPDARDELAGRDPRWERVLDRRERIEWRFVVGTERHIGSAARANIAWADVVVIWAPTRLGHAVSDQYTGQGRHARTVVCTRRGFGALAEAVAEALGWGPGPP